MCIGGNPNTAEREAGEEEEEVMENAEHGLFIFWGKSVSVLSAAAQLNLFCFLLLFRTFLFTVIAGLFSCECVFDALLGFLCDVLVEMCLRV